jgi:hypothetical protein
MSKLGELLSTGEPDEDVPDEGTEDVPILVEIE